MATGADFVITEAGKHAVAFELVTETAIGSKSGSGINPRMRVHMHRVGKFGHNRPLILMARERKQIIGAGRRESGVALGADLLLYVLIKIILMAGCALVMTRTLKNHRSSLCGHMTSVAINSNLLQMVLMQMKGFLRLARRD